MLDMTNNTVQVALVATAIVTLYLIRRSRQKKYILPPGPRPLPIVGNLLSVASKPYMFIYITELSKTYGDIFTIYMGPRALVILNTIESVRETFLKKGVEFANRPDSYTGEIIGKTSISLGQYTPEWKLQRKIAHSALRKFATGERLQTLLQENSADVFKLIDRDTDQLFDPFPKLTLLIYNVICTMVFGKRFEYDDPFFVKLSSSIDDVNSKFGNGLLADIYPIFKYLPSPTASAMIKLLKDLQMFMQETWQDHLTSFEQGEGTDFVHHLIAAKLDVEKDDGVEAVGKLREEHYYQVLLDMFFAGTDTSRFTLYWAIGLCVEHLEVQARMHQEIDEVVGLDQPICQSHRPYLPYTEAVLHEVLRMYPVAPLGVPRATSCDVEFGDYIIPKDTWVMPNIWSMHHNPAEWDEPERFKPERHLDEFGKLGPKPNSFLPFSTGRRVCVGESVAKAELHLLLAMLFQRYVFLPPPGGNFKMEIFESGVFCMPKPYQILAKLREQTH